MSASQGFKAVVIDAFGGKENFKLVANYKLEELKEGFVRVQIRASAFNPVDWKLRKGLFGVDIPAQGLILGADFSGVITEVGPGVKELQVGDEVYGMAIGATKEGGTYAEQVVASQHIVAKKPQGTSHEYAASFVIGGLTAVDAVINRGKVAKHHTVLVAGASGGVGTHAIQLIKNIGAKIIATVGSQESTDYLQNELKVDPKGIINYKGLSLEELVQKVTEANGGRGVDVGLDFVGGLMKHLIVEALDFDGNAVTIVEENDPNFRTPLYPSQSPRSSFNKNATFHTVFIGAHAFSPNPVHWQEIHRKLNEMRKLIESGVLQPVNVQILGSLSAETVKRAHELLEEGHVKGKLVMTI